MLPAPSIPYFPPINFSASLRPFLAACTSLTALHVDDPTPQDLESLLSPFAKSLTYLEVTRFRLDKTVTSMPKEVADVLDLHCASQLRRWRCSTLRKISRTVWRDWRAACQSRGIEPRGYERYFTGEICSILSFYRSSS
jgi:uncharacterized protein (DUF2236 family)